MTEPFEPPPAGEPIPASPSDCGAPDLPDPVDDGTEYVDPLEAEQ